MRLPSPVLIKPREMKKATTISQIVLLPNPLSAWLMVSVPESAVVAIPSKAIAPIGSGLTTIPTIVATKIARRCQALASTPDGGGTNQIITPTTNTPNRRNASSQPEIVAACLGLAGSGRKEECFRDSLVTSMVGARRWLGLTLRAEQFESSKTIQPRVLSLPRVSPPFEILRRKQTRAFGSLRAVSGHSREHSAQASRTYHIR